MVALPREEPVERLVFEAQFLMERHPPVWKDPNKQVVFRIACPPGTVHRGQLTYSRWRAMSLPPHPDLQRAAERVIVRKDSYDYQHARRDPHAVEWHVNFADPQLFGFYGSALFAQDEIQVAEHPVLGALREALAATGHATCTVENRRPRLCSSWA